MNRRSRAAMGRRLEHEANRPQQPVVLTYDLNDPVYLCSRCGEPIEKGQRYRMNLDASGNVAFGAYGASHETCP